LEITYIYPIEMPATGSGHTAILAAFGTGLVALGAGLWVIGRRASR
jgi:LPXTG-motif cell wall-anchored protein